MVDPQFTNALADRLPVAEISGNDTIEPRLDTVPRDPIPQGFVPPDELIGAFDRLHLRPSPTARKSCHDCPEPPSTASTCVRYAVPLAHPVLRMTAMFIVSRSLNPMLS